MYGEKDVLTKQHPTSPKLKIRQLNLYSRRRLMLTRMEESKEEELQILAQHTKNSFKPTIRIHPKTNLTVLSSDMSSCFYF